MTEKAPEFNEHFIQLIWGLQSTAWIFMGKHMNPSDGKTEIDLDRARDAIDTLLMLREKTKGNLSETEKLFMDNAMTDLELNFIDVKTQQEKESASGKTTAPEETSKEGKQKDA